MGLMLAGALGTICSASSVNAQTDKARLILAMDDVSSLVHLPVLLAQQLGYFKAEGLLVDIVEQPVNVFATNASAGMVAWSVPFTHILPSSRRDEAWRSVMQTGKTPQLALGVSKKTLPGFKSLKDFEGHRIGVLELDSFAQRCVDFMLSQAGVNQQRVTFIPLGSSLNAIQAFKNGLVDALCVTDPLMTLLDKRGEITIVRNLRSVRETSRVFAGLLPGNSLCVPASLVTKDPKICQALVNSVARALKWLRTAGPSDLLHTMTDSPFLPDRALYLNAVENLRDSFSADGNLAPEVYANALRVHKLWEPAGSVQRGTQEAPYTNEFVMQAKKRFKM
jgi:NitT/TauT family transport system substrate-binding protein